jgi:aminoglycoside 6'-N-acetyltransferase
VPVSVANRASWRALERAGFHRAATGELTPDNPSDGRDHYIYHRSTDSASA